MSDLDLDRLEALSSAATPGPWYWQQTKLDINLVSRSRWSPIILGFGRWGMNRAQPLGSRSPWRTSARLPERDWRGLVSTFYLRKALEVEPGRAGTGMSDQLYRFTSVEAVQRHTDSPPEIPEDQIGVQAAIDTIARAIIASAAEDAGEWEDWPEVGEHDWNRVLEAVKRLAPWPDDAERSAAYQLLESMSDERGVAGMTSLQRSGRRSSDD